MAFNINDIKFDSNGLVATIAYDVYTNRVLMMAYMNRQSLEETIKTKQAHYFSRSQNKLWRKGETSGHTQQVVSIAADCDADTLLLRVIQTGPACHTNAPTCFFNGIESFGDVSEWGVLRDCIDAIKERKKKPEEGSYTNYLLGKGKEKVCKKIAEESGEAIIAAMKNDNLELANETADLLYHLFVLFELQGMDFTETLKILEDRRNRERARTYGSVKSEKIKQI